MFLEEELQDQEHKNWTGSGKHIKEESKRQSLAWRRRFQPCRSTGIRRSAHYGVCYCFGSHLCQALCPNFVFLITHTYIYIHTDICTYFMIVITILKHPLKVLVTYSFPSLARWDHLCYLIRLTCIFK